MTCAASARTCACCCARPPRRCGARPARSLPHDSRESRAGQARHLHRGDGAGTAAGSARPAQGRQRPAPAAAPGHRVGAGLAPHASVTVRGKAVPGKPGTYGGALPLQRAGARVRARVRCRLPARTCRSAPSVHDGVFPPRHIAHGCASARAGLDPPLQHCHPSARQVRRERAGTMRRPVRRQPRTSSGRGVIPHRR